MPLQPPRAFYAGTVMTRLWCQRAKLDGQIQKARIETSATHLSCEVILSPTTPPSLSTSTTLPRVSAQLTCDRLSSDAIVQVRKLPSKCAILLLILLALLSQPVMCKPWFNIQPTHVTFQSKICQPKTQADLQRMLDRSRITSNTATAKRTFDDSGNAGYQGDEPRYDLDDDSVVVLEDIEAWNPDDDIWVDTRGENIYSDDRMVQEVNANEIVEGQTWIPRRKVTNRRFPTRMSKVTNRKTDRPNRNYMNDDVLGGSNRQTYSDSYSYMKRRKRRSLEASDMSSLANNPDSDNPNTDEDVYDNVNIDDFDEDEDDFDSKDKKSSDNIHLRLFLRGKDKKTRKQLKKKLRQKVKNLSKPPPWECKLTQRQRHMKDGVFPATILDGKCEVDKCFYRLYNCEPIKYALKLLLKDKNQCNPLPTLSNETVYEERWGIIHYHVTVGCNCASPNVKSRRRD